MKPAGGRACVNRHALSRVYRGEHHPADILGSLLFSALWLTATSLLIKPNADDPPRSAVAAASRRLAPTQ